MGTWDRFLQKLYGMIPLQRIWSDFSRVMEDARFPLAWEEREQSFADLITFP